MKLIIISNPVSIEKEANIINKLFENGLKYFHLRKPGYCKREIVDLIQNIDSKYHSRISLHSEHFLVEDFDMGGIHLTGYQQQYQGIKDRISLFQVTNPDLRVSASFHQIKQIKESEIQYNYVFLSPIFHSISKKGYKPGFKIAELKNKIIHLKYPVLALGGCRPENLSEVQDLGFAGAAFLGFIWQSSNPIESYRQIQATLNTHSSIVKL